MADECAHQAGIRKVVPSALGCEECLKIDSIWVHLLLCRTWGDGGCGFVVARKRFSFPLPDAYAFTLDVHGVAPANKFEFKLVDPGGQNVWRYQAEAFDLPAEWRSLRIGSSQIDFAWGPAGSGPMRQVGALEVAITAPPGGNGTLWIANLCPDYHGLRSTPAVQASSASPGHEPRFA